MYQYTVFNGGDVTRLVVWGGEDEDLEERLRLRDALGEEPHIVVSCTVEQRPCGCDPFKGTIHFCPQALAHKQVQQLRIETTDSAVLTDLQRLFTDIESGHFCRIGVEKQAEAPDFVNFYILFHKAGALV